MTKSHIASRMHVFLFAFVGVLIAALSLFFSLTRLSAPPVVLLAPQAASDCTDALMDNICQGNFEEASSLLYGSPDLELDRAPADAVGVLLWDAYVDSTSYEFLGDCYASGTSLARDVRFVCLDIGSVTDTLGPLAQQIFQDKVDNAEDTSLVYDSENNYREDFIAEVMCAAVEQSLKENARYTETTLTLQLAYYQGQWLVVADQTFLNTVFGGING